MEESVKKLKTNFTNNIDLIFRTDNFMQSKFKNEKMASSGIYEFNCECGAKYLGNMPTDRRHFNYIYIYIYMYIYI